MLFTRLCLLLSLAFWLTTCSRNETQEHQALTPKEALKSFELAPGFQIELIAAEPLLSDPVDMTIDEFGRIYVVEMHGYPLDLGRTGKIKLLTDTDNDGRPDQSILFADSLLLPTGIMRWKQGVVVTDPPEVIYFEDSDGDGKADKREVLLTGFALSNPQHNLNNPEYGLDNWLYLAHEYSITTKQYQEEFGDEGAEIYFPGNPTAARLPKNADERNVRFKPDTYELEMLSSSTQFGQAFDLWGQHFMTSNYNHLFHEVIAARYLQRNPALLIESASAYLPSYGPGAEVFPITQNPEHQLLTDVGVMTSACGLTTYLGGLFPVEYNNVLFSAEPVHNLVHTDMLVDKGATFSAERQFPDSEFLASTDAWFRPVNFYVGPDGALYMLDYYRKIIEHPEWMSDEVNTSGELYAGDDLGRLYRITPEGTPVMDFCDRLSLAQASVQELISYLEHPNRWWRINAQRLLVDRGGAEIIPGIKQFFQNTSSAVGQVHALWTLEGLGHFDVDLIRQAFLSEEAGLRISAIRIAELHLKETPALEQALLTMTNDPDAKVRYQLLCTLGDLPGDASEEARRNILIQDLADDWVQIAALTGFAERELDLLLELLPTLEPTQEGARTMIQKLSAMIGFRNQQQEISRLLDLIVEGGQENSSWWQTAILEGFSKSVQYANDSVPVADQTMADLYKQCFSAQANAQMRSASLQLLEHLGFFESGTTRSGEEAATVAFNDAQADDFRRDALQVLAWTNPGAFQEPLKALIDPTVPLPLQEGALKAIATVEDTTAWDFIFAEWPRLTPELRDKAVDLFMETRQKRLHLLRAIEAGQIQPATLGWRRTVSLLNSHHDEVRSLARSLLEGNESKREVVTSAYQTALELQPDAAQGAAVFEKACAQCHLMQGKGGIAFGPDLAGIRNRTKAAILRDILEPNRSIADGYELWMLEKRDGSMVAGIIAAESPNAVTLRDLAGTEHVVARAEIKSLIAQENSGMPEGLESQVNEQEMADLLAFLKGEG